MRFSLGIILSIIWCLVLTNLAFSSTEKLEAIKAAIKAKGAQWTAGETWVFRLSPEEFRKLLGARDLELEIVEPTIPPLVTGYPLAIDWRNRDGHNWVTSVKNQGEDCGSCVSFAALATLESLTRIEQNQPDKDVDLSEMDICNCHYYFDGIPCCSYWYNSSACSYLWNNGAPDEVCWPYEPINMSCSNTCYNWQERAVKITNYGYIWGEEACKTCVAIAPILAEMAVYDDFSSYIDGIYEYTWDEDGQINGYHAVCIVGYNANNWPLNYWIVKNSWGDDDWGEEGFARIKMGECGIETIANYWMSGAVLPTPPTAPSNLTANAITDTQVNLSWTDNSNNESGFEIQRKEGGGIFSLIDTVQGDVTSYEDKTVSGETTYYYQIRAYNVGGNSAFSNTTSVTTPPIAPSNLNAEVLSSSAIRITWQDNSNSENGFEIWQKKGSGSWQLKSTVGANVTSKDITGLDEGTTYCYRVRAYSSYGNSDWSNTDCDTTPPNAPSNLDAGAVAFNEIDLNWQDNSNIESGFEIWQQKEGGSWQLKSTVGANITSKDITGLEEGTTYCYKIRAYSSYGNSDWSNTDCDTTPPCPPGPPEAPSNLAGYAECFDVLLMWEDNSNNEEGFKIERAMPTSFVEIDRVGPNSYSYGDNDLECQRIYIYRVRAYNAAGDSPYSNIASTKTTRCRWCEFLSLEITPDKEIINSGEPITYTYEVENKEKVDLTDIELIDDKFGKIAAKFTLKKGERKTFTKTITLTETTANFAEATAIYHYENKTEIIKSHASAIVEVRK